MQHFIGCDVHTRNQVVAWIDEQTGEIKKRRLEHAGQEVKEFYAQFPRGTVVGIEATFPAYWFERLLGELGHELWVGDAARIRASEVRYQKTDDRDAEDILDLLRTGRFPRIWVPSLEERDLRQLLVHRMKQVRARTQVKNQLHALAISQGVCRGRKLWSVKGRAELEGLALLPWGARRRKELLESLDRLDEQVRELDRAVEEAGRTRPEVALLRTHPGVGMVVGLAFVLSVGPIERFPRLLGAVRQLAQDQQARDHVTLRPCLVQPLDHFRHAVAGVHQHVGVEQPDHMSSGGAALPPASRPSRRMRMISSVDSPCHGPRAAIRVPSPGPCRRRCGTARSSTSRSRTRRR